MCRRGRVAEAQGGSIGAGDGGGAWVLARAGMTVAGGPLRVPSGQASTGSGRTDSAVGVVGGGAPPPHLWIPAFAGKTGVLVDGDAFGEVAGAVYGAAFPERGRSSRP